LSKKQEDANYQKTTSKSIENDKSGHATPSKKSQHNHSNIDLPKDNTSESDIIIRTSLSSTIDRMKQNPETQKIRRITEKHEALEFDSPNLEQGNDRRYLFPEERTPFLIQDGSSATQQDSPAIINL